ncbi:MAG: hypothetical protein Q9208_001447 [Pyrenodesmia sp. 3 TL-2023]
MSGLGYFLLFLLILIPLLALAYIFYARIQAQRAGRSPPSFCSFIPFRNQHSSGYSSSSSSSGGIIGTIRSKFQSLTGNNSRRTNAYAQPLGSSGRQGRGLDPDGAWDTRVGEEADAYGSGGYYEEQELGLRTGGHGALPDYGEEEMMGRGRSISRDGPPGGGFIGGDQRGLDKRYDEATGGRENPFGDQAERSELRGVSPRPAKREKGHQQQGSESVQGDSPTERRSMFHENM